MRSLVTRRAALATGVATLAAIALAGCSAGQVAETSLKKPSVYGVNAASSDQSVFIRNLAVAYQGSTGYPAGADATLQVGLYNQTRKIVTVLISSRPADDATGKDSVVSAQSVGLVGGASATPSAASTASPEPSTDPSADPSSSVTPSAGPSASAPAAQPARIEIAPLGAATFLPEDDQQLRALGLGGKLVPGQSLNLVFEFSTGAAPLVLQAPVAIPLVPASRAPGVPHEDTEE
jgi:hypothetical protein